MDLGKALSEAAALRAQVPAWEGPGPRDEDSVTWFGLTQTGELSNGMRYYVRSNSEPRDRVECSVIVRAGSIDEREDERGLAHMIEHLAFRGRKDESGSWGVMRELESRGVKFGSHQNAYTSFEETVYWVHVPSDFASRAIELLAALVLDVRLSEADVEAERKIVVEEWRQGKDWSQRASETHFRRMFAGTKFASRLPIGSLEVIEKAPASRLRSFYERYYVPGNMAACVVGDLVSEEAAGLLEGSFGRYASAAPARAWPRPSSAYELGCFWNRDNNNNKVVVSIFDDFEATQTTCSVSTALRWRPPTTVGVFRDWLADDVFHLILNRRLQKRALEPRPPFSSASAALERPLALSAAAAATAAEEKSSGVSLASLTVEPTRKAMAASALREAWREVERARRFGFSEAEVDVARVELLTELVAQFKERDQTDSAVISDECRDHFLLGIPVIGPEAEVKLTAKLLDDLTCVEIQRRVDALYARSARKFVGITRPTKNGDGLLGRVFRRRRSSSEDLDDTEAFEAALLLEMDDGEEKDCESRGSSEETTRAFFFEPRFEPGEVSRRSEQSLVDQAVDGGPAVALELELNNGMRVVFARTRFRDDEIVGHAVAPGGLSEVFYSSQKYNKKAFVAARSASTLAREYGLFGVPKSDAIDALGGRRISVNPGVDAYRRFVDCDCASDDLERMLAMLSRLFCADLCRDPRRLETFLELAREGVKHEHRDPKSRFVACCDETNANGHAYFARADLEDLDAFDADATADFFDAAFGSARGWTLALVGALPRDEALLERLAAKYLASIPETRRPAFPAPLRQKDATPLGVCFPTTPRRRVLRFSPHRAAHDDDLLDACCTRLSFSVVVDGSGRDDDVDSSPRRRLAEHLRLDLCSALLETRLVERLRLNESAVYDVSARVSFAAANPLATDDTPLCGVLSLAASHDPRDSKVFVQTCLAALQDLSNDGPTTRELDAVLECARNDREEHLRRNSYWASALSRTYLAPRFDGTLADTYRETVEMRDAVHADLRADPEKAKHTLSRTLHRAVDPNARTIVSLLPSRSPFHHPFLFAAASVAAAVVALGAVVAARSKTRLTQ
ncbi:hypothetical protein CTAYLR_000333 [Chrysophaeum taylorii]|uniref:Uncharacterized protein n=1 Tax=Chrysophaeum taylorii TaxID=2483200 RepID=A0AAD7XPL5_9STRA|nr:hypothetical protein CTAYLR_000333 [Chrysophaeum taylorii]